MEGSADSDASSVSSEDCDETAPDLALVQQFLKDSPFFQELSQAVQDKLPSILHRVSERAGAVLFQQGDAPGHCYILLSGKAGVWKKNYDGDEESQLSDNSRTTSDTLTSTATGPSSLESSSTISNHRNSAGEGHRCSSVVDVRRHSNCAERRKGGMGFGFNFDRETFYNLAFGSHVITLGPGAIFGELALIKNQPRSATITCLEDCELFIIQRSDFDAVMKCEMTKLNEEKFDFLLEHLPGMRGLTRNRIDKALYLFNKVVYPRGHIFLTEGVISEKSVFVIARGTVALSRRKEHTAEALAGNSQANQRQKLLELMRGSVFGSCVANTPEPFSVFATSECEVLYVDSQNLSEMPLAIAHALRDHLALTMIRRLEHCGNDRNGCAPLYQNSITPARRSSCSRAPRRTVPFNLDKACPSLRSAAKSSLPAVAGAVQGSRHPKGKLGMLGMLHLRPATPSGGGRVVGHEPWADKTALALTLEDGDRFSGLISRTTPSITIERAASTPSLPRNRNRQALGNQDFEFD